MAARVLLLSILFTEVLQPVYCADIEGVGKRINERNGLKQDSSNSGLSRNSALNLEVEPKGDVILGKRGITLSCNVKPKQDIIWLHNGEEAPPCEISRCTMLRNGSLHFYKKKSLEVTSKRKSYNDSLKNSMKDEFRCVVRTNFGGYLRSSPVVVKLAKLPRKFKEQPKSQRVFEGEVTRLSCSIDTVPFPPNITWEYNSKPLLFNQYSKKYISISPGVLYINATESSDAGYYRCIATNSYLNRTTISVEAELNVVLKSSNQESYPSLIPQKFNEHMLIKNSSLQMACAVSGYPASKIEWTFLPRNSANGTKIFLQDSVSGISVLSLKNVELSEAGMYICSTKNSINNTMKYQNITVNIFLPPTFIKKPTNQICPNGRTARFEYQVEGYPKPQIYWLKDGKNLTINGRRTIYEDSNRMELTISATVPSDSGVYQCVAVNEAGETWAAGRLQVTTSRYNPDTPTALKCRPLSPWKIHISWEPPKYLPSTNITAYTVHYSPIDGGKEEVSPPELGNVTSMEVTKLLEPFTNYSVYVRLYSNHRASDQSTTITCFTAASVPKTIPKMKLNVISNSELNVTWEHLSKKDARGIIVEYKLQWRLHQHPSSRVVYLKSSISHYILTDLSPGTIYDVRVLARTEQGWPEISEALLPWLTIEMPSLEFKKSKNENILNFTVTRINGSTFCMRWSRDEKLHPDFDSWRIVSKNKEGEIIQSILLPKNSTRFFLTNSDESFYSIGLCMIIMDEAINCVNKLMGTMNNLSSNIPTDLEAIPTSTNSMNLTWNFLNATFSNTFEVCYHAVQIKFERPDCLFVNGTAVTINNLEAFTLYQFKVRALHENQNQKSEFSEAIECYTDEDVPGKIESVYWFLVNSTSVRIAWKRPSGVRGIIQKYLVVYTLNLSDSNSWENVTVPGNKTMIALPSLASGRRYFVMVQAATKAGSGKFSDPIVIITSSSATKIPNLSDGQKPSPQAKPDKSLGVVLGLSISIICIGICLFSIYCRKNWKLSRNLRGIQQPSKMGGFLSNGNGCCIHHSLTSINQHIPHNTRNEIELSVLCPPTSNFILDTKVLQSKGVIDSGLKEPLLFNLRHSNTVKRDSRVKESSQYEKRGDSNPRKQQKRDMVEMSSTTVNFTTCHSITNLNNNLDSEVSSVKITSSVLPVLEPNG